MEVVMKKNNFNQSSSGVNIELFLGYDIELSQINFDDNFEPIKDSFIFYKDFGNMKLNENLDYYFNIGNTKQNRKGLLRILNNLDYFSYYKLDAFNVENLIKEIIYGYELHQLEELDNLLIENHIKFTTNFECIEISGYSQNAYNTVLVDKKQFKEVNGIDFDFDSRVYRRRFKNYCYDSPLSCRAIINNKEYCSETLDEQYIEFDKEIFITDIIKQVKNIDVELLTKELNKLVPEDLSY